MSRFLRLATENRVSNNLVETVLQTKFRICSESLNLTPSSSQTITPMTFFEYTVEKPLVWTIFYLQ